jgi:hypothetical protein
MPTCACCFLDLQTAKLTVILVSFYCRFISSGGAAPPGSSQPPLEEVLPTNAGARVSDEEKSHASSVLTEEYRTHLEEKTKKTLCLKDLEMLVKNFARGNIFRAFKFPYLKDRDDGLGSSIARKLNFTSPNDPAFVEHWDYFKASAQDAVREKRSSLSRKIRENLTGESTFDDS